MKGSVNQEQGEGYLLDAKIELQPPTSHEGQYL